MRIIVEYLLRTINSCLPNFPDNKQIDFVDSIHITDYFACIIQNEKNNYF